MIPEEKVVRLKEVLDKTVIREDAVRGFEIHPMSSDLEESKQVVGVIQNAWSNNQGNPAINFFDESDVVRGDSGVDVPATTAKLLERAELLRKKRGEKVSTYFYPDFNNPFAVAQIGEYIEDFCKGDGHEHFEDLENLSFTLRTRANGHPSEIVSAVNLQLNHDNESVEWGRLVTQGGYTGHGFGRAIFELANDVNHFLIGYLMWSDSNTMHKTTQNLNKSVGVHAVGFSPLKFSIPNFREFLTQTDKDGIPNAKYIYFGDGRVSTTFDMRLSRDLASKRNLATYVAQDVKPLQKLVLEKFSLAARNHNDRGGDIPSGRIDPFVNQPDPIMRCLKLKSADAQSVSSVIKYVTADDPPIEYVEVDIPAIKGSVRLQEEYLKSGFFPIAYLPAFSKQGDDQRADVVRLACLGNHDHVGEYIDLFSQGKRLEKVLIDENLGIGQLVMSNLQRSYEQ